MTTTWIWRGKAVLHFLFATEAAFREVYNFTAEPIGKDTLIHDYKS